MITESLVNKLEKEVGLSHREALKTLATLRTYMKDNDLYIDWKSFLEGKSKRLSLRAKRAICELSERSKTWYEKVNVWRKAKGIISDTINWQKQ